MGFLRLMAMIHVFRVIFKKVKIFYSIICLYSVYMMDNLFFFKKSSKMLFHYISMFFYIKSLDFIKMIWRIYKNISFMKSFTAFPCIRFITRVFFWIISSKKRKTLLRTKSPIFFIKFIFKKFITIFANYFFNHFRNYTRLGGVLQVKRSLQCFS